MSEKPRSGWIPHKLNELGFVGRGRSRNRPRNDPSLYNGPYPFIQTADIMYNEMYISSYSQTYTEKGLAQSKMWDENTLCMTIAGANTAETAILKIKACFPDSIIGFIADPEKSDVRFVKYYLDTIKDQLKSVARGTTQHNLPLEKLFAFDIYTPPLPTQRKIAAILSAYDDLIENNTRRIAILEEMAQALYREWFVHFRFPGHEPVRLVESELGPVPEGWEVVKLGDLAIMERQGINPKDFPDEFFAHYSIPAYDSAELPLLEKGETIKSSKYVVLPNCVLLSKLNPRIPRVWLPELDSQHRAITSTEFLVMLPKGNVTRSFLFSMFSSSEFLSELERVASGTSTSHQRVKPQMLLNKPTLLPRQNILKSFTAIVTPMFEVIANYRQKNTTLRQTRDLLLPRLISGEVDVSALAIEVGKD